MEVSINKVHLGINELTVVANSKTEVFMLLKYTWKYYLLPLTHLDADYIHDIMTRIKKVRKPKLFLLHVFPVDQIKFIFVSFAKNLKVSDILKFGIDNDNIQRYIPTLRGKDFLQEIIYET